jgi:hypothetical protein
VFKKKKKEEKKEKKEEKDTRYSEGRDWEDPGLRPAQEKISKTPISIS